jgi:hypothetical protein
LTRDVIQAFQHRKHLACQFGKGQAGYLYQFESERFSSGDFLFIMDRPLRNLHVGLKEQTPPDQDTEHYGLPGGMSFLLSVKSLSRELPGAWTSQAVLQDSLGHVLATDAIDSREARCQTVPVSDDPTQVVISVPSSCTPYPFQAAPKPYTAFSADGLKFPIIVFREKSPSHESYSFWDFGHDKTKLSWDVENTTFDKCHGPPQSLDDYLD